MSFCVRKIKYRCDGRRKCFSDVYGRQAKEREREREKKERKNDTVKQLDKEHKSLLSLSSSEDDNFRK